MSGGNNNVSTHSVLVTGATGFLGRHLLGALHRRGLPAIALVRKASDWPKQSWLDEVGDVTVVEGTPLSPDRWQDDPALSDVKTIIHSAAVVKHSREATEEMLELNVEGTLQMVRAAHRLGARLIFVSSSGTVGCFKFANIAADEHAPYAEALAGQWPYYESKIRAEREARRLAAKLGVELVVVRPPVLLGPGDHRFRSSGHVMKVLEGKLPVIPKGGMHFTDIRDAADAMAVLPTLPRVRSVYHLPGTALSLREFFQMVGTVAGESVTDRQVPGWVLQGLSNAGARASALTGKHPPRWLPDPVVAEMASHYWGLSTLWSHHELGYSPRKPWQTLIDTVTWLRANHPELRKRLPARR